jgi:glycosyltransferase involved in cell wall biosynthesis
MPARVIGVDASRAVRPASQRTGTELYSRQLILHLASLVARRTPPITLRLYSNTPPDPGLLLAPATWRVMPFPRLWTHVRLSVEMLRHPPDVLFVPAHVLPLWHPARSLVTVHDLGYLHFPDAHPPRQRRYLDGSTRWNARVATRVLVDSQATARDLTSMLGTSSDKIRVVYPGFESRRAVTRTQPAEVVFQRYEIRPPYVLTVGTLQPRKNLARLAHAMAQVLATWQGPGPRPQLVLAGRPGWLSEDVQRAVTEAGLGDACRITGYVPEADLAVLLANASLLAFPSLYEGFGFPILEAQAAGIPVLTSTTSSCPEVAGQGALLVDPMDVTAMADGLHRLLYDEALRTHLVQRGRENLPRFAWDRAAQQVLDVLDEILHVPEQGA